MNSKHAGVPHDGGLCGIECRVHLLRRVGEEGRKQGGCAEFSMCGGDCRNSFGRWGLVEQDVAPAVHLKIDESRRQPGALGQGANCHTSRHVDARHQGCNFHAVDYHGSIPVHYGAVEDVVGRDGVP